MNGPANLVLEGRSLGVALIGDGPSPLPGQIDVSLFAGDVLAVTGASGSGKTTLLRCLAMLEADATGSVQFRGDDIVDAAVPAYRRQVVYVAQTPPRFSLSVAASLSQVFEFSSATKPYDSNRAVDLAARLLLPDDVMERRLADLSGGESLRVAVLRALLLDPVVLLLDEPTSALDPEARDAVVAALLDWLSDGSHAAAIVSHDEDFVSQLASRRAVLRDGALIEQESV